MNFQSSTAYAGGGFFDVHLSGNKITGHQIDKSYTKWFITYTSSTYRNKKAARLSRLYNFHNSILTLMDLRVNNLRCMYLSRKTNTSSLSLYHMDQCNGSRYLTAPLLDPCLKGWLCIGIQQFHEVHFIALYIPEESRSFRR